MKQHLSRALGSILFLVGAGLVPAQGQVTPARALSPFEAFPGELSSFAAIDRALAETYLVPPGAEWRYFIGTEEPSPDPKKHLWTKGDFDESAFRDGVSPLGFGDPGFPGGEGALATTLEEMRAGPSTLYLRTFLNVSDPNEFSLVKFEMPINDGYVFFLNGKEEDRAGAGPPTLDNTFDGRATSARRFDELPLPQADLTGKLFPGENTLAIHALDRELDERDSFGVLPTIRAVYEITPEGERKRRAELRERLGDDGTEARLAYLEGRHHQRLSSNGEAEPHFVRAAELDPEAVEPWSRRVECARALGTLAELDAFFAERVAAGNTTPALLDAWAGVILEDLGGSPVDLVARVPADLVAPESGTFSDALYAGRELAAGRPLRIDCGAAVDHDGDGSLWSRDRFFRSGQILTREEVVGIEASVRVGDREHDEMPPMARIPLPPGIYEVRLHLVPAARDTAADQRLGIVLEGALVLRNHDPLARAGDGSPLRFPVLVADGFLDLDLLPGQDYFARIAALEVHPLETGAFKALAEAWVAETGRTEPLALVQTARAELLAGETRAAFDLLEEAARLRGFRPEDAELLDEVQDGLLPNIPTLAAIDRLVARRPGEAPELLDALRAAATDVEAEARALYLEGRILQTSGQTDDALGPFEELVFSGTKEPEPFLRFAECLDAGGLHEDAEGFLREALEDGVRPSPELLLTWISISLEDLSRDPWELIKTLREIDAPDELVVVPTSEYGARQWQYSEIEPSSTTWSRPNFDAREWTWGPAGVGSGILPDAMVRSLWDTQTVFMRTPFTLTARRQLYPHVRAYVDDVADVYLNGTRIRRIHDRTKGWDLLAIREDKFLEGQNYLGIYAVNSRGAAMADAGVVVPVAGLIWILDRLEADNVIRLNCGGDDLVTSDGKQWYADRFYCDGQKIAHSDVRETEIAGTVDDALYHTQRWFNVGDDVTNGWDFPVPNGKYRVTLHFAETDPDYAEPGKRVFDVLVESFVELVNLDLSASAGFATAVAHTFEEEVTDGWLDVWFTQRDYRPTLAGLELERVD